MRQFLYIIPFFCLIACDSNVKSTNNVKIKDKADKQLAKSSQIDNYMSDNKEYKWINNNHNSTKDIYNVIFHSRYATFEYQNCTYYYYINKAKYNAIELLWSTKNDCSNKNLFFEKANNSPKVDDKFARYTLINDTTIQVDYYFKDWVNKINESSKDSIFPTFLFLKRVSLETKY